MHSSTSVSPRLRISQSILVTQTAYPSHVASDATRWPTTSDGARTSKTCGLARHQLILHSQLANCKLRPWVVQTAERSGWSQNREFIR
jgi:hypothetical protein